MVYRMVSFLLTSDYGKDQISSRSLELKPHCDIHHHDISLVHRWRCQGRKNTNCVLQYFVVYVGFTKVSDWNLQVSEAF